MKRKYNIGDIYVNNQGESFKIINYIDSKHVEIEFLDSHFKKIVSSGNIAKKRNKRPLLSFSRRSRIFRSGDI